MFNLSELVRGGTVCLSKTGLAVGSNTAKMKILAPNGAGVDFAIKGVFYHIADTDDICIFTAATQAALTTCLYLVTINSANTILITKGTEVVTADLTAGKVALTWPTPTAAYCPIGAVKVVATSVFTAGTTALGTGNAATYYDLLAVPDTPITS